MKTSGKALAIFDVFLETHQSELSIAELAKASGLNKRSVYRIVSLLMEKKYLSQRRKREKYFLGPKLLELCHFLKNTIKAENIAHPFLEKLCEVTGESVYLSVLDGNKAVDVLVIQSNKNQMLKIDAFEGNRVPLHSTATGKVFLSYFPEEDLETFLKNTNLNSYTDKTITDSRELKKQLKAVKRKGVAYNNEEMEVGIRGVAAPVKNWEGQVVACIGVIGPSPRLTHKKMLKLSKNVIECAQEISKTLGWQIA